MASHDACTSGISRVLTVASLQRLMMKALIPAPTSCEVWSVIKFLNAQSIAPIEIHQLCQFYSDTWFDGQYISCRSLTGKVDPGGSVVITLATGSEVHGFKPGWGRWIFSERKNPECDFRGGFCKVLHVCATTNFRVLKWLLLIRLQFCHKFDKNQPNFSEWLKFHVAFLLQRK